MVVSVLMVPLVEFAIARNVFPAKVIGSPVVFRMPVEHAPKGLPGKYR